VKFLKFEKKEREGNHRISSFGMDEMLWPHLSHEGHQIPIKKKIVKTNFHWFKNRRYFAKITKEGESKTCRVIFRKERKIAYACGHDIPISWRSNRKSKL
jgi:hypothetical protein